MALSIDNPGGRSGTTEKLYMSPLVGATKGEIFSISTPTVSVTLSLG